MVSDRLLQTLRSIERRGIELDNRAVALVKALYRQVSLDDLTELLDVAARIDSSAQRVGYAPAILDQFDKLAAVVGPPPPGMDALLRSAVRLGITATRELIDAQSGAAYNLPAKRELEYLRRSQTRFREFWSHELPAFRADVQDVLETGLRRGQTPGDIMVRLRSRQSVSRSRAALIVRNETSNAQASAMQRDQEDLGYTRYVWSTSKDRRVRKLHEVREGKVFEWDKPPSDGHPGQPIMCRCLAVPSK